MVPLVFIFLVLAVIFGVKRFLLMDGSATAATDPKAAVGEKASTVRAILPPDNSFEALTEENFSVGDPEYAGKEVRPPEPFSPPGDSGIAALRVLEDFLKMSTLEERLPHIETKREEAELVDSVLNEPLPEVLKITVDIRVPIPIEQVVDHYYHVDFADEDGGADLQTILVRTRGTEPPKVVVDPFLDLFGGRFARFAATPSEKAGTFLVVISAGGKCYDDVPGADKKLVMKILAREDTKEIARAYFGEQSRIGRMLRDETSGLSFGMVKPCTVFLRWNVTDDPQRPFLEALDIKALNWNP